MIPEELRIEYEKYLGSKQWKEIRDKALERVYEPHVDDADFYGCYYCQKCEWHFKKEQLEVHHLHYRSLKFESIDDLLVLCLRCHDVLDKVREKESSAHAADCLYEARLDGWASKVYGEDWELRYDITDISERFDEFLENVDDEYCW